MCTPTRIQLRRTKGFRLQEASLAANGLPAAKVDRTTRYGNDHGWSGWRDEARDAGVPPGEVDEWCRRRAVDAFRADVVAGRIPDLEPLRGLNLACWCPPAPGVCHADVLLELANAPPTRQAI